MLRYLSLTLLSVALILACGLSENAQRIVALETSTHHRLNFKNSTKKPPYSATLTIVGETRGHIIVRTENNQTFDLAGSISFQTSLGDWYTDAMSVDIMNEDKVSGEVEVEVRFNTL